MIINNYSTCRFTLELSTLSYSDQISAPHKSCDSCISELCHVQLCLGFKSSTTTSAVINCGLNKCNSHPNCKLNHRQYPKTPLLACSYYHKTAHGKVASGQKAGPRIYNPNAKSEQTNSWCVCVCQYLPPQTEVSAMLSVGLLLLLLVPGGWRLKTGCTDDGFTEPLDVIVLLWTGAIGPTYKSHTA